MWTQALLILASALAASLMVLAVAYQLFERRYKKRLRREVDDQVNLYRKQFHEILDRELVKLGDIIEERVRTGVVDAVRSLSSTELLQETTQSVVKTGVDLAEASLGAFLGTKPRKKE